MSALQVAGIVVATLLAGGALLAPGQRGRAACALGALVLTPVLLIAQVWSSDQLGVLREQPLVAAGAALGGLVAVAVATWGLRRRPTALPLVALAVLPLRIPIEAGGASASLLVSLYLVIGAGVLAWAVPVLRRERRGGWEAVDEHESERDDGLGRPGALEWLLTALIVLFAVQAAYSSDLGTAAEQVVFFYVPFALLFVLLARLEWTRGLALRCLGVVTVLALVLVGIGFYEYVTRTLLLNPKVIASNQVEEYFRINSLFFDPNIFGRFLAVVMLGVAAAVLWTTRRRIALAGVAVLAVLWGGLVLTLSQSSFVGLLVGLAVLAALRWGWRRALPVALAFVVAGVGFVVLAPQVLRLDLGSTAALDNATSGRYDLVSGGVELAVREPLTGLGSGAFEREYRAELDASSDRAVAASHTIPVTVAAEQGLAGLAVYLALLVAALSRLLRGAGRSPARAAVAAAFVALIAHTMLYAAFLEDPLTWALLGVGVALARPHAVAGEAAEKPAGAAGSASSTRPSSAPAPEPV
ncbi:MAG: O-antigen ligase family protein [Solirubrobacteraceae bacterium MAG38_C4-C5]|nr:O-antigen ligase family protein [Candidatus Siliceabacter maunaloa]